MKRILKFQSLVLLAFFVSVMSCQRDDETREQEQPATVEASFTVKMESGDHLREINSTVYQKLAETSRHTSSLHNTEDENSNESFTLDLSTIQIIERTNYIQYTTSVFDHSDYETYLINYMLLDFNDGSQYQFLIKYPRIITDQGVELDLSSAVMERVQGNTLLQTESAPNCLNGSVPELLNTDTIFACTSTRCTGNGQHELGDDCQCYALPSCSPPNITCEFTTVNTWSCTGGSTQGPSGNDGTAGGNGTPPTDDPTDDEPIETIPFVPYWQQVVNCVNDGGFASLDPNNPLPLSTDDINWLQSRQGSAYADSMSAYIHTNGCEASEDFIDEAVEVLQDDGEVDYEEKIIMDGSLEAYPCQKKIIKEAYSLRTPILDLFRDIFEGETVVTPEGGTLNVTYKAEYLGSTLYSAYTKTNIPDNGHSFKTVFNTTNLNRSTDLSIVNTTVHEAIHAVLLHYYNTGGLIVTPANADPTYKELVEAFVAKREEIGGDNFPQHTYMIGLKDMISDAVYLWATTKSTYTDAQFSEFDSNNNDTIQDGLKEFCKILAWSGLMDTTAFDELYPVYPPNPARDRIEKIITDEGGSLNQFKGTKASTLTCND